MSPKGRRRAGHRVRGRGGGVLGDGGGQGARSTGAVDGQAGGHRRRKDEPGRKHARDVDDMWPRRGVGENGRVGYRQGRCRSHRCGPRSRRVRRCRQRRRRRGAARRTTRCPHTFRGLP